MHHKLDITPEPQTVLYVNEPQLCGSVECEVTASPDNVRVYVPLDLSRSSIMSMLYETLCKFGDKATEANEIKLSIAVDKIIRRLEIYDQVWFTREGMTGSPVDKTTQHSKHGKEIAALLVEKLNTMTSTAEKFPYTFIDELCDEYGIERQSTMTNT